LVDCKLLRGRRLRAQVCGVANIHRVEICCIGSRGIAGEFMSVSQVIFTPIVVFIEKIGPHHTSIQNLNTLKLNSGFEFHQLLVSLKHVINLVMWIRYTGCHTKVVRSLTRRLSKARPGAYMPYKMNI
jgi:hypothetical protein